MAAVIMWGVTKQSASPGMRLYASGCVLLTAILILVAGNHYGWPGYPAWIAWALLVGGVELLPVPTWRGLTLSVGFPLLIMIAILYPPNAAAVVAFLGASDPREMKREVSVWTALFNRSQVALSVLAA